MSNRGNIENNKKIQNEINYSNINNLNNNLEGNNINNQKIYLYKIFEKENIFNSLLIKINNIPFIIDYFSKTNINKIINKCEEKDQCLTSILYYINKYMWKAEYPKNIRKHIIPKIYKFY